MFAMLGSESGSDDENGLGDGNCMQHREAEPATLPRGDAVATGEVHKGLPVKSLGKEY